MKIARIETFLVPPRWLFCRVEIDDGVVGWGEPVVERRAEVVRTAVEVLAEYLVGRDPLRVEDHWQVLQGWVLPGRAGALERGRRAGPGVVGHRRKVWRHDDGAMAEW
jgi:L-alanine-DL-glutamate epimerase-like enolase superfamily enzyme